MTSDCAGMEPRRLWSLWDMLREHAEDYIRIGREIEDFAGLLVLTEAQRDDPGRGLREDEKEDMRRHLRELVMLCKRIRLPIAAALIEPRINNLPRTAEAFRILTDAIEEEIKSKLFLLVPTHLTRYYERKSTLTNKAVDAFPSPYSELMRAGNAVAFGLPTASVFHSMRAAEIGMRCMATALGVTFSFPIELAEWGKIVGEIEPKIEAIKQQPRSLTRDADLQFYSEAASQFRYFNDGWRIRVSHARVTYEEPQALSLMLHTREFFETLATRLRE